MVESDVMTLLHRKFRADRAHSDKWTAQFRRAMEWAIDEIWHKQMTGVRVPRERDFEW
jgi:hypothetical protein